MSILINMEMPKKCSDCPFFDYYLSGCRTYSCGIPARYGYDIDTKPDWCSLIEVPDGHGDLVDINELKISIMNGETGINLLKHTFNCINNAPIIIPMDEEET